MNKTSCFDCRATGCDNLGKCNFGVCQCLDGFGDLDCTKPLCGKLSDTPINRPISNLKDQCQCGDGFTGVHCNVCTNDDVCRFLPGAPLGARNICNQSPVVWKSKHMTSCDVSEPLLTFAFAEKGRVTFERNIQTKSAFATLWLKESPQFTCNATDCSQTFNNNGTSWKCTSLSCNCNKGAVMCSPGLIDLTKVINGAKGDSSIKCDMKSNCNLRFEFLSNIFSQGVTLPNCRFGECVDEYSRPTTSDDLVPGYGSLGMAIVSVVFGFLGLIFFTFLWGLYQRNQRRKLPIPIDQPGILYEFQDISYFANGKTIVTGISGTAHPGELLAIMGPSGSGKSTCLDILANKEKKGVVMGSIKLNGKKIDNAFPFQNIAGYVDQEDIHLSCLTVREILEFSAQLRLPESMSVQQKSERVQLVLTQLGLAHVADSRIGNTLDRGISGGEKRRLSIGIELVTNPSILFLDEPTSGLDSYNALQVIQTLSNLAKESKKTIIFTIHQPNSTIFSLFDKLLLLSDGIPIYFGSSTSVEEFCVSKGSPCPPKTHIADHVLNYACEKGRTEMSPKEAITPSGRKNSMLVGQTDENGILDDHSIRFSYASSLTQLQKVLGRSWKTLYRNPLIFISHVIISVSLGLFIGFLYLKVDSSLAGIQNRLGSIFFLQSLIAFSGLSAISSLQADLVLFVRERSNGFYGFFPYFVSKVLFDLIPLRVLPSTIMCSIAYYLIGYSIDQTTFFKFLGIMVIFSANSGLFCLMIGCLIRDNATAILVASITTLFQMLFAGILINQVQIPITLRWIQYLSFFKYAYEACVVNDAAGLKLVDTISGFDVTFPAAVVLEKFGLDVSAYWKDLAVSVGLFLTLLILISLTIKLKLKQNK